MEVVKNVMGNKLIFYWFLPFLRETLAKSILSPKSKTIILSTLICANMHLCKAGVLKLEDYNLLLDLKGVTFPFREVTQKLVSWQCYSDCCTTDTQQHLDTPEGTVQPPGGSCELTAPSTTLLSLEVSLCRGQEGDRKR